MKGSSSQPTASSINYVMDEGTTNLGCSESDKTDLINMGDDAR